MKSSNKKHHPKKEVIFDWGTDLINDVDNGFARNNIPQEAIDKLATLNKEGKTIYSIAFTPNGGWVILCEGNGYIYSAIPQEAANAILKNRNAGFYSTKMAFTPSNGWALLYSNSNPALQDLMQDMYRTSFQRGMVLSMHNAIWSNSQP